MAVRYKFRSSVNFDSVDIDGRPSISIRDLKSKIIQSKKLNVCQDFDLVFADALTGQEYTDENFQISSGSSVIIKRVPAGLVPKDKAYDSSFAGFGAKVNNEVKTSGPVNVEINFDDFGIDLCPVPDAILACSNIDVDKNECIGNGIKNVDAARYSEPPTVGFEKLKPSSAHSGNEENNVQETKPKPDVEECIKTENATNGNPLDVQNTNFPSELKCSLCNTLFKEAVMIPCCQHSFCLKCIRSLLIEKARCPKCLSSKCRAEDLLPNVSLRQAIEHFLESHILFHGSDNALNHYAPDGESGIQAKGVSCAVSVLQKEPKLPDSPSATGRGSNRIVADECDSLLRNHASVGRTGPFIDQLGGDKFLKSCSLPFKVKKTDGDRLVSAHPVNFKSSAVDLEDFGDFQGESQPIHEEEDVIKKKRGLWVNTSGVDKNFMESGRHKKGDRTCYMCGSPDHFIRDCPAALNSNPMFQRGNVMFPGAMHGKMSPYWNGPPLPHTRPLANIYGTPGMMPFNATMVPVAPYGVPTYMPSMLGSVPAYGGFMTMRGATAPLGFSMEHHPSYLKTSNFQDHENKRKLENEYKRSGQFSDDVDKRRHPGEAERLHDLKSHSSRERSESYCKDNDYAYRSHRKYYRDIKLDDAKHSFDDKHDKSSRSSVARDLKPYHHSEKLSSEVENMPSSSSWHDDDRHKKHSRSSKRHNERMNCHDNESRYPTNKEEDVERKRVQFDVKRHDHKRNSHPESGLEPSYNSDERRRQRKKDSSHAFRHSRHNPKSIDDELNHDRWLMVRGSNKDGREDYRSYKRKRDY